MKYYLAPLEGITGYVYRNVYHQMYGDMDKYFTPFIVPNRKRILRTRERKDIAPENNRDMYVVPQILTNQEEQFLLTVRVLMEQGYHECNLNLGCPVGTVVAKGKGSGFLADTAGLDRFFANVFTTIGREQLDIQISVKTRIGMEDAEEFYEILNIYNRYPFSEVIIHPRLREDYYKYTPNLDMYGYAMEHAKHPLCYNGDIFDVEGYHKITERFPTLDRVMLGRGVICNPALVREITTGERMCAEEMRQYHALLLEGYLQALDGEKDVLFKMKELWHYMSTMYDGAEKYLKKIKKSNSLAEYRIAAEALLNNCDFL